MSRFVAVDFGGSAMRALEFSHGKDGLTVHRSAELPIPKGIVSAGQVTDVQALSETLRDLWRRGRLKSKDVVFGVMNPNVIVKTLSLDWLHEQDMRTALRYQLPEKTLLDGQTYEVDGHRLAEYDEVGPDGVSRRKMRVQVVAAESQMVEMFVRALEGAGLKAARCDLSLFALARAAAARESAHLEVLVDLGAHSLTTVLHRAGQLQGFNIKPEMGGDELTARLMNKNGWDREMAERTKVNLAAGIARPALVGSGVGQSDLDRALEDADEQVHLYTDQVVAAVQQHVDYYLQTPAGAEQTLKSVVLCGGGAPLPDLAEKLRQAFGQTVTVADPTALLQGAIDTIAVPARWNLAFGLATGAR